MIRPEDLEPHCPAAELLDGPPAGGPSVVCGVMKRDAQSLDRILQGTGVGVHLTMLSDPSTVLALCCGTGSPVTGRDEDPTRQHYTNCPIWQLGLQMADLDTHRPEGVPEPEQVDPSLAAVGPREHTAADVREWMAD